MPGWVSAGVALGSQVLGSMGTKAGNSIITNPGDTSALAITLQNLQLANTPEALNKLIAGIFNSGLTQNESTITSNAGKSGLKVNSSSSAGLQENDLLAQLTASAQNAVTQSQSNLATAADNYSKATQTQTVQQSGGSGGCFITTVICEVLGKPDDCDELTVLRTWRDSYMLSSAGGKQLVELYYLVAPRLVDKIRGSKEKEVTCNQLLDTFINPAIEAIEAGDDEEALMLYHLMVKVLQDWKGE